jgi:hypothetical protein
LFWLVKLEFVLHEELPEWICQIRIEIDFRVSHKRGVHYSFLLMAQLYL